MTHRRELEHLIRRARARGAKVEVGYDNKGYIDDITISGLKGVVSRTYGPLDFAETLRRVLPKPRRKPAWQW